MKRSLATIFFSCLSISSFSQQKEEATIDCLASYHQAEKLFGKAELLSDKADFDEKTQKLQNQLNATILTRCNVFQIDADNKKIFFRDERSDEHVLHYEEIDSTNTLVTFRHKKSLVIPISVYSFQNQMLRTSFLRTKFMQRIDGFDPKSTFVHRNHSKASENKLVYGDEDVVIHKKAKRRVKKKIED